VAVFDTDNGDAISDGPADGEQGLTFLQHAARVFERSRRFGTEAIRTQQDDMGTARDAAGFLPLRLPTSPTAAHRPRHGDLTDRHSDCEILLQMGCTRSMSYPKH
jgi:hypothetical protein